MEERASETINENTKHFADLMEQYAEGEVCKPQQITQQSLRLSGLHRNWRGYQKGEINF